LPESCFPITSQSDNNLGCARIELIGRIISCLPYNLSMSSSSSSTSTSSTSTPSTIIGTASSTTTATTTTMTHDNVFYGLPSQLRAKLSTVAWLPGILRHKTDCLSNMTDSYQFVIASKLLVVPTLLSSTSSVVSEEQHNSSSDKINSVNNCTTPSSSPSSPSSNQSDQILLQLLIDYLQIYEPHPALFMSSASASASPSASSTHHQGLPIESMVAMEDDSNNTNNTSDADHNSIIDTYQSIQHNYLLNQMKMDALYWLGAQTISIESLINLATNLKPEDINRPGLLSVLMSSFDACLTAYNTSSPSSNSNWSSQSTSSSSSLKPSLTVYRRRLLTALQHLPIFPLTNGQCIRLNEKQTHCWCNDIPPMVLLP
ncbi:unnamed protein product, partial [Schistosoma turkestanicum]